MIPLKLCKEILNKGSKRYSDEEIETIRGYLYKIGAIQIEIENNNEEKKLYHECIRLCKSKHRRAS